MSVKYNCQVTYPNIQKLSSNEIFVFGSNAAGRHGAGAAKLAYQKFGAVMGVGVGRRGNSYALPTKDFNLNALPIDYIKYYVQDLYFYITVNPELTFLITEVGCGLAGYTPEDIAPLFKRFVRLSNCALPESFIKIITNE